MSNLLGSTALAALLLAAPAAIAQPAQDVRRYDVAPGPLDQALTAFARQSGQQILYSAALTVGRRSPGLSGEHAAEAALTTLLRDSGLAFRRTRPGVFVLYDPANAAVAPDGHVTELEEVVVTGSHLRGASSPSPVVIVTRDDVDRRGRATVAEVLADLPQNFTGAAYEGSAGNAADRSFRNAQYATGVNLRGLGADATLVLVNGRRITGTGTTGDFADVSNLPTSAIHRVDVLLDGASALYGADAVGGVVNIILKRDYEGFETRVRAGGTTDGGAREFLFSQLGGLNWSSGNLVMSYEYYDRGELLAADRRATANADLRPLGGSDWRETYAAPGNIMFFDPTTGAFTPEFAIPPGQDGVGLTPGDFLPGVVNRTNQHEGRWSLPHQKRHSVFAALRQELGGGFTLDADLRLTQRDHVLRSFADIGVLFVTDDNPYFASPDGLPFHEIAYSFINDLGPGLDTGRSRSWGGAVGLEGALGGWNLSLYASGGRETNTREATNRAQQTYVAEALGAIPDDPNTPFSTAVHGFFNPYGDPAANSPEILAFIGSGYGTSRGVSTVATVNFKADRSLFELPGGPLRLALGADFRREAFRTDNRNFFFGTAPTGGPRESERDVSAAFAELRVPLVGPANARPGIERLELSLAGRTEHYEHIGSTTNPKVGVLYAPSSELLLRASYGESFRAPSLPELTNPYQLGPVIRNDGVTDVIAIVQYGGNPDLRPETAQSITAGFVWTPAAAPGLRLEGGWFRTSFRDRISRPVSESVGAELTDPSLAPFVTRVSPATNAADRALVQSLLDEPGNFLPGIFPAEAYGAVIDSRFVNAAIVEIEGVDVAARYAFDAVAGRAMLDLAVTHLLENDRQITVAAPAVDLLGQPHFPARWRGRAGGHWTRDGLSLGLGVNFVSGGRDPVGGREIGSWTTFDGQVRYDFDADNGYARGLSLTLNALNLLNRDPPFYDSPQGIGYDAANTHVLGRQVSLQLVKRW